MLTTIDRAGRVVVPKAMRDALGLAEGGAVEIDVDDGRIVLSPAPINKRLTTGADGRPVIIADRPLTPLTTETVRATLEAIRR